MSRQTGRHYSVCSRASLQLGALFCTGLRRKVSSVVDRNQISYYFNTRSFGFYRCLISSCLLLPFWSASRLFRPGFCYFDAVYRFLYRFSQFSTSSIRFSSLFIEASMNRTQQGALISVSIKNWKLWAKSRSLRRTLYNKSTVIQITEPAHQYRNRQELRWSHANTAAGIYSRNEMYK